LRQFENQTVSRKNLHKTLLDEKAAHKMLVKLTLWVDFTNMFTPRFYERKSQKVKKD